MTWHEDLLVKWLEKEPAVLACACDVLEKNEGKLQHFWFGKFLWDVLYGNGFPWMNQTQAEKVAIYVPKHTFPDLNFKNVASTVRRS